MAKLKIQAPDGKTLVIDVTGHDRSEYDNLASAAVEDYMGKKEPVSIAEQNLRSLDNRGPLDELGSLFSETGKDVRAGGAGIGDLVGGNGLQKAASNVENVENDKSPTTFASGMGEGVGGMFTPDQIAIQAGLGAIFEALGPALKSLLKSWGAKAAVNAVGKIKKIADALGIKNLENLGKFLLTPIKLGSQEFEPIVQATSSPQEMLEAAEQVQKAAGKQLGNVAKTVDKAIQESDSTEVLNLTKLRAQVEALRQEIANTAPNLGKAVQNQYQNALADLDLILKKAAKGETNSLFSDLSNLKTVIGDLTYKHGSALESKAALQDVYMEISRELTSAAEKVEGEAGPAYQAANQIYHQITAVIEALEGRTANAAKLFDAPALITAIATGVKAPGLLAIPTALATYAGARMAENYAPQALAAGLNASPALAPVLQAGIRAIPLVGSAIASGLRGDQDQ